MKRKYGDGTRSRWDAIGMNLFLGVMGAGVLLAAWLLMQQAARNQVVYEFSEAARAGDLQTLSSKTDWGSVRDWMKKDMKERASYQRDMSIDNVDAVVDDTVRPERLMDVVYYLNRNSGSMNPLSFVSNPRFSGITEFTVELMVPASDDPNNLRFEPIRAGFALEGLNWKLKRLDAPSSLFAQASQPHKQVAGSH